METISKILVALVAIEHVYILYMEMFLWTTPRVRKTFGTTDHSPMSRNRWQLIKGYITAF